jgi:3-oxoacyl-[acyl-carrier-protein] synthase-3
MGVGAYVPEQRVTNEDIVRGGLNTTHEWISARTGIVERRIVAEEMATSDLATHAAQRCLANAGVLAQQVDLIVVATSSPDQLQPAVACMVQEKLGVAARHIPAFDVNSVCAGFVYGLQVAQGMMLSNPEQYRHVLVIGAETYSKILNWNDRRTCVFFGDGAGAMLLGQRPDSAQQLSFLLGSDGRGSQYIGVPAGGTRLPVDSDILEQGLNKFYMNGPKVWEFALDTVPSVVDQILRRQNLTPDDVDLFVLHQANLRLIEAIMEKLGQSMEKTLTTVQHYGNTAAASIPITLQKAFEQGRLKPGTRVLVVGFGGGLAWGAALFEW